MLKHLNISKEQAVSAGDSFDDVSMFKETGISIAMGNGMEIAKDNATIIADTIGNHGLAVALAKILK